MPAIMKRSDPPESWFAFVKLLVRLAVLLPLFGLATAAVAQQDAERAIVAAEARRAVDPAVVAMLDGPPATAARAALALGRTKRPQAREPLRGRLFTNNPSTRAMVAYALGLLEDPAALVAERQLARSDANSAVRYAAVDAIGRIVAANPALAVHAVADDLIAVMRVDADADVRGHAAAALEVFRSSADAVYIANALVDMLERETNRDNRWHIMWTIFRAYATQAAREPMARALADPDELVRIEAVRAWARRGTDPEATVLVTPLLADQSWRVQEQAREALRVLAKQPLTEHLAALQDGLHLPAADRPDRERALPRPSPAPHAGAPGVGDLPPVPALTPATARQLNGPLPGRHPRVRIRTTQGDIVLRLYPEWARVTVANFLHLADAGYFDGNRWFRIVPDFVVQTGDPNDNGEGDAGFTIPAEENPIEQRSGVISMGLNYKDGHAIRDSAGAQFYITISPQLHLDRDFTVFGEVESGMATIARLVEKDRIVRVDRLPDH